MCVWLLRAVTCACVCVYVLMWISLSAQTCVSIFLRVCGGCDRSCDSKCVFILCMRSCGCLFALYELVDELM